MFLSETFGALIVNVFAVFEMNLRFLEKRRADVVIRTTERPDKIPNALKTYHADIWPQSSLPIKPSGVGL